MKKLFLSLALLAITLPLCAVPARPGQWTTITLTNGTQVAAELCGDEYMCFYRSADGTTYVLDEQTGYYAASTLESQQEQARARHAARDQRLAAQRQKRVTLGTPTIAFQGTKKALIILVQFEDWYFQFNNTLDLYKQIVNEENFTSSRGFVGSVKDYFKAQSYGQFEIDFDVVGPVTMPEKTSYYGADTGGNTVNGDHFVELVTTACRAVDDEVNFADYDWDGDGEADLVFILFAGYGQNNSSKSDDIWPHMGWISGWNGAPPVLDGVTIDNYACSCELRTGTSIDGIGTICHEFTHCFGLPDLYDMYYGSSSYTMGRWDVLAYGNYNGTSDGDGFIPASYTSYERWFCGWLEPTELRNDCDITGMLPLTDAPEAYVIYNDRVPTEYYLLENRNRTGWDAGTMGTGLLVLHIDYSANAWAGNYVNYVGDHRYTIIPGNNSLNSNNEGGQPYPSGKLDSLTNNSSPAARLRNANIDHTMYMNKPITNITRNSDDGTIAFTFTNNNGTGDIEPDTPTTYVFYESFDKCGDIGGNDGVWEGSQLQKTPLTDYTDNEGWVGASSIAGYCGWMCAVFGSESLLAPGNVTSPTITTDGDSYLTFKIAPYTGDGNVLNIALTNSDITATETTFTMVDEQWTACETLLCGGGTFAINFSVPAGRFFLDEVYVTYDTPEGIVSVPLAAPTEGDNRVYTLDGRCLGTAATALKHGIYIINGKKVVM